MVCVALFSPISSSISSLVSTFSSGSTYSAEDFDTFTSLVMTMQQEYGSQVVLSEEEYEVNGDDVLVDAETVSAYSLEAEETSSGLYVVSCTTSEDGTVTADTSTNRLIVYSTASVDDCGAVLSANYDGWYVLQYDSAAAAEEAYDYYNNLGVTVDYDELVTLDDYVVEETSDDGYVSATTTENPWSSKTFWTWGASYVGYSSFVEQMYLRNADSALANLPTVYVAVLDSGIYKEHNKFLNSDGTSKVAEDLGVTYDTTDDVSSYDYDYRDLCGHGTHVSGTIAECTLDNVKIIPVKVLNSEGSGYVSSIVSGLKYIVNLKSTYNIVVANMSIGIDTSSGGSYTNSSLKTAIQNAYNADIISVVSAGNDSQDTTYASPANVDCAFTISALSTSLNLAYYSNYGSHVDFACPGSSIKSAGITGVNSYATMSGTSMAAPHATAAVALIYSNPLYASYSTTQVYQLLVDSAEDLGDEGKDDSFGYGMINIANIGVTYDGYVSFSASTQEVTGTSLTVYLTYTPAGDYDSGSLAIYYSTVEEPSTFSTSSSDWNAYSSSSGVTLTSTTRLTAVATYTLDSETIYSYSASEEYYFNNIDLLSNYTFTSSSSGYILSSYNGTLTTLKVQSTYDGSTIYAIGSYAFKTSSVSVLYLPNTITSIQTSAFESNTTLTSLEFYTATSSSSYNPRNNTTSATSTTKELEIGTYAFYKCTNLSTFDDSTMAITSLGDYSFAYCTSLTSLQLFDVETIGKHAVSGSGLTTIWIGGNATSIGTHSLLSIETVYGYAGTDGTASVSETFATNAGADFVDLTTRFTKDLDDFLIVETGKSFTLSVEYFGYGATIVASSNLFSKSYYLYGQRTSDSGSTLTYSSVSYNEDEFGGSATITFPGLEEGTYEIWIMVYDSFSTYATSNTITVSVTSSVYEVTSTEGKGSSGSYSLYAVSSSDSMEVDGSALLQVDETYDFQVVAESGYKITSITIGRTTYYEAKDGEELSTVTINGYKITEAVEIVVTVAEKDYLDVTFELTNGASTTLASVSSAGGDITTGTTIARDGGTLSFTISPKTGYVVSKVTASGATLVEDNGTYTLSSATTDVTVTVTFASQKNTLKIVYGVGGTVSSNGIYELVYGESETYTITPNDGYIVSSVTVNGEPIMVFETDGHYSFTVTNLASSEDETLTVRVSFKETGVFFGGNTTVMYYFIVFLGLFVLFFLARIFLFIFRRKKKKMHKMMTK